MLERIILIKGVGLFSDVKDSTELGRVSLFHGENGKGKSTLAWLIRSASRGVAEQMPSRGTLGHTGEQEVKFLFNGTGGRSNCTYTDGVWNNPFAGIEVFDSIFIDDNVFSGMAVDSKQRQQLLTFVLGDAPVAIKKEIDEIDSLSRKLSGDRSNAEQSLRGYAAPLAVEAYVRAEVPPEIDAKIAARTQQLLDVKNSDVILKRNKLQSIKDLDFCFDHLRATLGTTIEDLETKSEAKLKSLLEGQPSSIEGWLEEGLSYSKNSLCPFCGTPIGLNEQVNTYKAYFSQAYKDHKEKLVLLTDTVRQKIKFPVVENVIALVEKNNENLVAWSPQLLLEMIQFPIDDFAKAVADVVTALDSAITEKLASPLERVKLEELDTAEVQAQHLNSILAAYRTEVESRNVKIEKYQQGIKSGDVRSLEVDLARLQALKKRSDAAVTSLINQYTESTKKYTEINKKKIELQKELKNLAPAIIQPYVSVINKSLNGFGADFEICEVGHSNAGGRPTVEYGLSVRGEKVSLGTKESSRTEPSFGSTLSEGDKRTLAFSFFIAKVLRDPNLREKVVVIDDPVSSLDHNRQRKTIDLLAKFAKEAKQLIVLSHDARFLKALRQRIRRTTDQGETIRVEAYEITRSSSGSQINSCNLDSLAKQGFDRKRAQLSDYIKGINSDKEESVRLVREVLESFLKLKYPDDIGSDETLGDIIHKGNEYSEPLKGNLLRHLRALSELNESTKRFHHGGNVDEEMGVTDAEALGWAQNALRIIGEGL